MTLTLVPQPPVQPTNVDRRWRHRFWQWLVIRRASLAVWSPLFVVCALVRAINFTGTPGLINDDEGTYVAQAWAILHRGQLAHYTYWYDHPPLGWITLAGWFKLTNALERYDVAVLAGRELMLAAGMASATLVFLVARRLGVNRFFSGMAMLLFAINPLSLIYGRMVFLDNLAIMWALLAMVFAASPRRSNASVIGAAIALAAAAMTKETTLLFLPFVVYMIVQNTPKGTRLWKVATFTTLTGLLCGFYLLLAVLKGEVFTGPNHVSLQSALMYQLVDRESSGSVFDPLSASHGHVTSWMASDIWLILAAGAVVVVALLRRRCRPIALGLIFHVLMLFRGGYLPAPYVLVILPFAALVVAMGCDTLWAAFHKLFSRARVLVLRVAVGLFLLTFAVAASPTWTAAISASFTQQGVNNEREAVKWVVAHVDKNAAIVGDDNIWPDLVERGYSQKTVDWFYKVDLDPAVTEKYVRGGPRADAWKNISYVVLPNLSLSYLRSATPIVSDAVEHSKLIQLFGDPALDSYRIYEVVRK